MPIFELRVNLFLSFADLYLLNFATEIIHSVGLLIAPLIVFFILSSIFGRIKTKKAIAHPFNAQIKIQKNSQSLTAWHILRHIFSGKANSALAASKNHVNLAFSKERVIDMNHKEIIIQIEKTVLETVTDVTVTETTTPPLEFSEAASVKTRNPLKRLFSKVKKIDVNHEKIATRAEDVSMTTGVVAGIAAAGATIAAPTGLAAFGVALGITSAPLIVTAAPILGVIATVAGTISGGTYFYSKWKNNKKLNKS